MKKKKIIEFSESRMETKKRERAQKILEVAFKCFQKNGFKNTTMARIAEKADMSVGTLYNYHRTKEELLLNGILLSREGFAKEIEELASSNFTCEEQWMKLTAIYLASFSRYGKRVWREFLAAVFSEAPERQHDIETIDIPFIAGIQKILQTYQHSHSAFSHKDYTKSALVIYQLWLQKIMQFILSESATPIQIQSGFLEDLRTIGILV